MMQSYGQAAPSGYPPQSYGGGGGGGAGGAAGPYGYGAHGGSAAAAPAPPTAGLQYAQSYNDVRRLIDSFPHSLALCAADLH